MAQPGLADLSYSQKIEVTGGGGLAMFSSEGSVVTQISGDRSRSEMDLSSKSSLVQAMGSSGPSVNIVRLDKELTWQLSPEKREYSQQSFEEMRAQLAQVRSSMSKTRGEGAGALPISDDGCIWSAPQVIADRPGDTRKIAGIKTRKHVVSLKQSCTVPDTDKRCDVTFMMESWLARKVPAEKEVTAFRDAYASAMGFDPAERHVDGMDFGMIGMFSDRWDEVIEELKDFNGYPLLTVMEMRLGGEQCTTASGQPIAMDEMWSNAGTAAYNAALDQTGAAVGSATGEAAAGAMGSGIAGTIGGAAVGAATSEIIGGFTGMFKKEKKQAPSQPAQTQDVVAFRVRQEVTAWSEVSVPEERFELPNGWTRVGTPANLQQ